MVKIRLQRQGKKKAPFYHIVVADSRSPRDGKIIEQIGTYDPMTEPSDNSSRQRKISYMDKKRCKTNTNSKRLNGKSKIILLKVQNWR